MSTPFNLVSFAALVFVLGLASAGLTAVVHALPFWPKAWLQKKPLGCPTCLPLWCSLAVVLAFTVLEKQVSLSLVGIFAFLVTWGAAMAIAMHVTVAAGVFVDRDALEALGVPPASAPPAAEVPPDSHPAA